MVDMLESRYRQKFPISGLAQLQWAFVGGKYNEEEWKRIEILEEDGLELLVVEEGRSGDRYVQDYLGDPSLFECRKLLLHALGPRLIIPYRNAQRWYNAPASEYFISYRRCHSERRTL